MGGVPKQRHTKSRRQLRRQHLSLSMPTFTKCSKCGRPVLSHHACAYCGTYAGRQVIDVFAKLDKKERKARQRELEAAKSSS